MKYLIQKIIKENNLVIDKKRCLHYRDNNKKCTLCIESCPTGAISSLENMIEVDEDNCNECGICKAKCPSQCISLNNIADKSLLKSIEHNEEVILGCNDGEGNGNVIIPCLNGLPTELLTIILIHFRDKRINFNISKCSQCSLSCRSDIFLHNLNKAEKFISSIDINANYMLLNSTNDIPTISPRIISRRELFSMIKEGSVNHATEAVNSVWGNVKEKNFDQRTVLIEILNELMKDEDKNTTEYNDIFANYEVSDKCNGCGYCTAICPWNAWQLDKTPDKYFLSHNAKRCRTCKLCITSCPKGAINTKHFELKSLSGKEIKLEIVLSKCKQCNSSFVSQEEDKGLCPSCFKRNEIRKSIFKR